MNIRLLPVGSVVTLNGAEKKILIIGTEVKHNDDETLYDYVGVPYPEGYIDSDIMFLFLQDDIQKVDFIGFMNAEYQMYSSQTSEN